MHVPLYVWAITIVIVLGFIAFDFYAHVRTPHEPTLKEAGGWTAFYVVLALLFGGFIWLFWDHEHGVEFLSGYVTEKALSVDNLFVFALIIGAFNSNLRNVALGGTSVIIVVGVALDTARQLESQMMMRHYKGFLE